MSLVFVFSKANQSIGEYIELVKLLERNSEANYLDSQRMHVCVSVTCTAGLASPSAWQGAMQLDTLTLGSLQMSEGQVFAQSGQLLLGVVGVIFHWR